MELVLRRRRGQPGRLTMAAISAVLTLANVAEQLGEDEDWLHDLSINMFPEDGCLPGLRSWRRRHYPFTEYGIECLKQIIADERAAGRAPKPTKTK